VWNRGQSCHGGGRTPGGRGRPFAEMQSSSKPSRKRPCHGFQASIHARMYSDKHAESEDRSRQIFRGPQNRRRPALKIVPTTLIVRGGTWDRVLRSKAASPLLCLLVGRDVCWRSSIYLYTYNTCTCTCRLPLHIVSCITHVQVWDGGDFITLREMLSRTAVDLHMHAKIFGTARGAADTGRSMPYAQPRDVP